jgi:hypothetical protein
MPQRAAGVKRRFQAEAVMLDLTSCSRTPYTAGASCRGNSKGENHASCSLYVTGVYPREQAPEAHRLLEGRLSQGKLVLVHPN